MKFIVGTRNQVRAALDALTLAFDVPSSRDPLVLAARYSTASRLVTGEWCTIVKGAHVELLPAELLALVVDDLPVVRRADPAYRATLASDLRFPAATLSPLCELVSSTRWMRPVVVRATLVDLPADIPLDGETIEHLWDTSEADPVGTRYLRADGQREFVVQQIANSTDHVFVLWFGGDSTDPHETAYAQGMIAAATALGVVLESVECVYADGAWLVGEIAEGSTIASRWPSTWHVSDADGLPTSTRCIREVVL